MADSERRTDRGRTVQPARHERVQEGEKGAQAAAGYAIKTQRLCKCYGGTFVVSGVDLCVPEGSVYGFIGPNGAGKSTTMKMLLGLTRPTSGDVTLLGRPMNDKNRLELLAQTGSLIESPACYAHLTAQENLKIIADLKGVSHQDIDRVLRIVRLDGERKRTVKQYSLGMRQRLGIAQALLGRPRLLILDEPTNGLDPAGIQEMRELIHSLPEQYGATVLISSHLLGELEQFIDHVGVIGGGKLLFQGTLARLRQRSRGEIELRAMERETALCLLHENGVRAVCQPDGALLVPALADEALAALVARLCAGGAGIVGVAQRTRSLEDIFLGLTGGEGREQA